MIEPKRIATGLSFPEGPAYDGKGNLYVSNCNADYVTLLRGGESSVAFRRSETEFTFEKTNGMAFFEDGSLFACDLGRKAIIRIEVGGAAHGRMEIYADKFEDTGFRGPNDLAFDPHGNLYFTDPSGSSAESPVGCVYLVERGNRNVTKVAESMGFPNGIAFSADAKTVYIAESSFWRILKADVLPDGTLTKPEPFVQLEKDNTPDGIAFDVAGNLYIANYEPGRVTIIDPAGTITGHIPLPGSQCTNVEFGGKDLKTLWITLADPGDVWEVENDIPGLPLFRAPRNEGA